ncbi:MAG: hypothetical protein AMXMBFR53_37530 [Gemmatimonadota bacterium]
MYELIERLNADPEARRRAGRRQALLLTLATLTLAGCAPEPEPDASGPLALAASDVSLLGTSDVIAMVRDLEVLPDGSVWILNSVEPYFVGFGADGTVLARHGTAGGGPREFRMPAGLLEGGYEGEAWAFDYVRHAFIRVSEPDAWAQVDLPAEAIPRGSVRGGMSVMSPTVRTARLGGELVVPWTAATMEAGLPAYRSGILLADFAAVDARSGAARKVVSLREVLEDPYADFVATDGGFPLWYRLWAVCGGYLRVHDRVRNQVRGFTATGEEVAPIPLPVPTLTSVTPEEFARAVFPLRQAEVTGAVGPRLTAEDSVRLIQEMAQRLTGQPHELAAYLPRYVDLRCSDEGVMWLQPIDLDAGGLQGSRTWLRIAGDGTARQVAFPPGFDPHRFVGSRVWGVQRDELDVASVAWIDLAGGGTTG